MKPSALSICVLSLLLLSPAQAQTATPTLKTYNRLPLAFEVNRGQTESRVKFLSRAKGYMLFLTDGEAVLQFIGMDGSKGYPEKAFDRRFRDSSQKPEGLHLKFVGENPKSMVSGESELAGKVNYFIGNDPKKWRTNISTYAKVKYKDIYPGIDLVYYGSEGRIEYDFSISPGSDPNDIRIQVDGSHDAQLLPSGDILLTTTRGAVHLNRPNIYQENDGIKKVVAGNYVVHGNSISFQIQKYDRDARLIIDPTLMYSTYLAGSNGDMGYGIAADGNGNAYVVGSTLSANFPTVNAVQPVNAGFDAFVTKLDPTGVPIYSTFLGGGGREDGLGITVDASGNAYVGGYTMSSDFPTVNPIFGSPCSTQGCANDNFFTKLSADGSALVYSTYLGDGLGIQAVALDSSNNVYVVGSTTSSSFL